MSHKILHSGIVEEVNGDAMKVRIVQTSACASCKVAGYCNAAESKEKIVDIYHVASPGKYSVGQKVMVVAAGQVGMNAVLLGFGLPFLIMVAAIFIVSKFTSEEPVMALFGLVSLIPYYIGLYLLRGRIREKLAFSVQEE